jgi:hypothetical protein
MTVRLITDPPDYKGAIAAADALARAQGWDGRLIGEYGRSEGLYDLARELAKPVARGEMPLAHALAALIVETLSQERSGALDGLKAPDVMHLKRHLLHGGVEREEVRRGLAAYRIERLIRPMIAIRKRSNAILAEAHGVNGAAGFPLAEAEVNDLVDTELFQALPRTVRRQLHVG